MRVLPKNRHGLAAALVLGGLLFAAAALGGEAKPPALPSVQALADQVPCTVDFFEVDGHAAFLLRPKENAESDAAPWVWYAPVLGHPRPDHAWMLRQWLDKGIAMAGVDVGESFGSPKGRAIYTALWETLVKRYGMSSKPCLLPQSRGGLMLYNWAAENPGRVSCVAGIYTVCDLTSYPGTAKACGAYGLSEAELQARLAEHNPVERLKPLAEAEVPILHVHGDADTVVPLEQNSAELARRYRKLGGPVQLIVVPGKGHQVCPEFFQRQELVDFVIAHCTSETRVGSTASAKQWHTQPTVVELYVSPDGDDAASGTRERPLRTLLAARDAIRKLRTQKPGAATIWLTPGRYTQGATLTFDANDSGTPGAPLTIRALPDGGVVLDGGVALEANAFRLVEDDETLQRLPEKARGHVWAADLGKLGKQQLFEGSPLSPQLSVSGRMLRLARWPNKGYAHIGKLHQQGAVYAHGRTKGSPPSYSQENPVGAIFSPREPASPAWAEEFARTQEIYVQGFLSYDWYKTTDKVARIEGERIQLLAYYRYPVAATHEKIPRRFRLLSVLGELDSPGEWYFDKQTQQLLLWPPEPIQATTSISVWSTGTLIDIRDAAHVIVRGLTLESCRGVPIRIAGGTGNLVAGCTIRNCGGGVQIAGGTKNGVVGCDVVDVGGSHIAIDGGTANPREITPAGNYAENNHLTQTAHDGERGVRIRGVGNVFRHNLIHGFLGQAIVYGGNDHLIELNEIYNVGIEEGDGGASYCGAAMWSYGNVLRHNFYHHLICIPQAHPRGGLYLDDFDAGETVYGNVFYKAAHRAVLINHGAANHVDNNLFVRCYIGVYNTSALSAQARETAKQYDSGELRRGDKMDYVWRAEQVVGQEGWNKPPWSTKYPLFAKVMNADPYLPLECRFVNNVFCENDHRFQYRIGYGDDGVADIRQAKGIHLENNVDVPLAAFVDPASLDLRLRPESPVPAGMQPIPFERIGLYLDQYRTVMPEKAKYRREVAERFESTPSYDPRAVYDPDTINDVLYP